MKVEASGFSTRKYPYLANRKGCSDQVWVVYATLAVCLNHPTVLRDYNSDEFYPVLPGFNVKLTQE